MSETFSDDLIASLPVLRRFALSLCKRGDLADDLVQITAERAFKSRDSYDPATRLDAWLFRILRNAWIDMTRRQKTQGSQIDVVDNPELISIDGRDVVESKISLNQTEEALTNLPDDQRAVLLLVCVEGLSYAEAADTLDVPKGTIMSRLARGRVALAKQLGIKS
ncbi:RNA polymerase sigma factor [Ahrensia marina]|uniref:RNA polymerase sigma factor n=1 Tax=Ahrensia marina TaxID=1514904 RepID=UPI0035CF388E